MSPLSTSLSRWGREQALARGLDTWSPGAGKTLFVAGMLLVVAAGSVACCWIVHTVDNCKSVYHRYFCWPLHPARWREREWWPRPHPRTRISSSCWWLGSETARIDSKQCPIVVYMKSFSELFLPPKNYIPLSFLVRKPAPVCEEKNLQVLQVSTF